MSEVDLNCMIGFATGLLIGAGAISVCMVNMKQELDLKVQKLEMSLAYAKRGFKID